MQPTEVFESLLAEAGQSDPYPLYDALREFGSVVSVGDGFLAALGHRQCDEILRDPTFRVDDATRMDQVWPSWREHPSLVSLSTSILQTNAGDHERMRRLVSGAFTARRVAGLREAVRLYTTRYVDWLADANGAVDFIREFAYPLPITMICELLGVPESDRGWFRPLVHDLTQALELRIDSDLAAADLASVTLTAYFERLTAAKRELPGPDLTSALAAVHDADPGQLSAGELLGNLSLLLVAGFETTTNLLGNGLYALLSHPDSAAILRADPALVGSYVEEMLRFDSPVQLTVRNAAKDSQIGGVSVPEGASVAVLVGAANRDPQRFISPQRFDPARPNNQPLSFGSGAHFCVGAALARLEAQEAFPLLLTRFGELSLAGEPNRRPGLTLRGFSSLPITVGGSV